MYNIIKNSAVVVLFGLIFGCTSSVEKVPFDPANHGPIIVKSVRPKYPEEAAQKGIEGEVWVKLRIDTLGKVSAIMIDKTPDPVLNTPALNAAAETKFKPAMMDGKPINVWFTMPLQVRKE